MFFARSASVINLYGNFFAIARVNYVPPCQLEEKKMKRKKKNSRIINDFVNKVLIMVFCAQRRNICLCTERVLFYMQKCEPKQKFIVITVVCQFVAILRVGYRLLCFISHNRHLIQFNSPRFTGTCDSMFVLWRKKIVFFVTTGNAIRWTFAIRYFWCLKTLDQCIVAYRAYYWWINPYRRQFHWTVEPLINFEILETDRNIKCVMNAMNESSIRKKTSSLDLFLICPHIITLVAGSFFHANINYEMMNCIPIFYLLVHSI